MIEDNFDNDTSITAFTGSRGKAVVAVPTSAMAAAESTRVAQEVQAAIVVAKKFPRDEVAAFDRIMTTCRRPGFAKAAVYAYPRGRETITGPSIRMAEAALQLWGNSQAGIRELETGDGVTTAEAYAWDMETNVRITKVFSVRHERKANGNVTQLSDPRDVYEHVANYGARRLRACILAVIPKDVMDAAYAQCMRTIKAGDDASAPMIDRIRLMVAAFAQEGVSKQMIERRLGHAVDQMDQKQLDELRVVYHTMTRGDAKRQDFFDVDHTTTGPAADLNRQFAQKAGEAPSSSQPAAAPADPAPAAKASTKAKS